MYHEGNRRQAIESRPFEMHLPAAPLSRYVQFLWIAQGAVDYRRERVLPNGVVEVIVNLGARYKVLANEDYARAEVFERAWVAGIQRRELVIEPFAETDLLGVRIRPGGARALLGLPMRELTDRVVELELLDTLDLRALRERLLEAPTRAAKFRAAEQVLQAQLDQSHAAHPAVTHLCARILAATGNIRVERLVADTGYSERRIRQLFERDVGMGAKTLAAVCRFQRALQQVAGRRRAGEVDWGRVAADCGYFDQAHFNHDFRRLAGLAPGDYLATRLPDINHTVVV